MSVSEELERLARLHRNGELTDGEFNAAKELLLARDEPQAEKIVGEQVSDAGGDDEKVPVLQHRGATSSSRTKRRIAIGATAVAAVLIAIIVTIIVRTGSKQTPEPPTSPQASMPTADPTDVAACVDTVTRVASAVVADQYGHAIVEAMDTLGVSSIEYALAVAVWDEPERIQSIETFCDIAYTQPDCVEDVLAFVAMVGNAGLGTDDLVPVLDRAKVELGEGTPAAQVFAEQVQALLGNTVNVGELSDSSGDAYLSLPPPSGFLLVGDRAIDVIAKCATRNMPAELLTPPTAPTLPEPDESWDASTQAEVIKWIYRQFTGSGGAFIKDVSCDFDNTITDSVVCTGVGLPEDDRLIFTVRSDTTQGLTLELE